ncbi:hypothetical protein PAXINDRAFT_103566 [Paxillus involutus ATCC 200175]|uniref:F-box domain-containing protein n=1 Tax=Paxillus involutus ATCC 200175 TaxID=664439 RepID=A0A0C9TFC1_PAXIN|nr:hypothetical protein PAXINDRAFT_103566 [Paxillus involutus ATCC 200175]
MSVIQWSTPERRAGDRDLPILPNEIYLIIFEHIAPTSTRLSPEQLKTFSDLSHVCKFFANVCLARTFEYLEFSGNMASRAWILCQQIAAEHPLALSLAQCVKICRFAGWSLPRDGPWAAQVLSRMKNIREVEFFQCYVRKAHWDVITPLESLEELSFTLCEFLDGPADVDPGKRSKVKVPRLRVLRCHGDHQPMATIDARHLRTLGIDSDFDGIDWLSGTALTELYVYGNEERYVETMSRQVRLKHILSELPQTIQVLWLPVYPGSHIELFGDSVWKSIPLLRSLTLEEVEQFPGIAPMTVFRMVCEGARVHRGLQSFTLRSFTRRLAVKVSPDEVRHTVEEQLNDISGLNFVDVFGVAIRLVDGKWMIDVRDSDSVL